MSETGRVNELMRFVKNEFLNIDLESSDEFNLGKVGQLEAKIADFMAFEGNDTGVGVLDGKDLTKWKHTLKVYKKLSDIIFNLENSYSEKCANYLAGCYFNLKTIEEFLTAVIIKGSKTFEEMEKKRKEQENNIEKAKSEKNSAETKNEHESIMQEFLNNPVPFIRRNSLDGKLTIDLPKKDEEKKEFFKREKIAPCYLIYCSAVIETEKEMFFERNQAQQSDKESEGLERKTEAEEKVAGLMEEYIKFQFVKSKEPKIKDR